MSSFAAKMVAKDTQNAQYSPITRRNMLPDLLSLVLFMGYRSFRRPPIFGASYGLPPLPPTSFLESAVGRFSRFSSGGWGSIQSIQPGRA